MHWHTASGPADGYRLKQNGNLPHAGGLSRKPYVWGDEFRPGGRGKGEPDTGTNHLGFRCVQDGRGKGLVASEQK